MKGASFPPEVPRFGAIERRISEELTLSQIEEISDQIFNEMTEKTRDIGSKLLGSLEKKREKLIDREIDLLEADHNPASKIERLKSLMFFLSPEEIEMQFEAIEMDVSLSSEIDSRILKTAERELQLLRFREEFRVVDELFSEAPSDFSTRMRDIAKKIQTANSLEPFKDLNEVQIKEIYRAGRNV